MIHHICLVRLRPEVTEPEIEAIFAGIHALEGSLPGLRRVASGRSTSPEKIERGYMHGLVVAFDDWAALARYHADPRVGAVGEQLVPAAQGGIDGILVFDLEAAQ